MRVPSSCNPLFSFRHALTRRRFPTLTGRTSEPNPPNANNPVRTRRPNGPARQQTQAAACARACSADDGIFDRTALPAAVPTAARCSRALQKSQTSHPKPMHSNRQLRSQRHSVQFHLAQPDDSHSIDCAIPYIQHLQATALPCFHDDCHQMAIVLAPTTVIYSVALQSVPIRVKSGWKPRTFVMYALQ